MGTTELGAELASLVDALEIERNEARLAVEEARGAVYRKGAPIDGSRQAWAEYEAMVSGVSRAIAAETPVKNKLTVAAELEQALKEGRWTDVGTWAAKLADLQGGTIHTAPRFVIEYVAPNGVRTIYWLAKDHLAVDDRAEASRFATWQEAYDAVPSAWEGLCAIREVTD